MNKDQIEGGIKEVAGKVQRKVGEVVGNPNQQDKGTIKEVTGKIQKTVGDAEESLKKANRTP
jgi:uncharacterized protein YjbJ (UPF0337 family)